MQERVTLVGNLTADPELRHTHPACRSPTCACRHPTDPRRRPVEGRETTFHTVTVWRDQAEHAAETLAKGARVIVVGRPKERTWTDQDGTEHHVTEVDAEELGPSLRWATATLTRTNGGRKASSGQHDDPPPS